MFSRRRYSDLFIGNSSDRAAGWLGDPYGRLVDDSQQLAERLLGNQIPQTIRLARLARENGAAAASAFGAGFGGSVWALVAVDRAAEFLAAWKAAYRGEFPADYNRSSFFLSGAGPPLLDL